MLIVEPEEVPYIIFNATYKELFVESGKGNAECDAYL